MMAPPELPPPPPIQPPAVIQTSPFAGYPPPPPVLLLDPRDMKIGDLEERVAAVEQRGDVWLAIGTVLSMFAGQLAAELSGSKPAQWATVAAALAATLAAARRKAPPKP